MMKYFANVLAQNKTRHVQVQAIKVTGGGAAATRQAFLDAQLQPLMAPTHNLETLVKTIDDVYRDLCSLGIYEKVQFSLDTTPPIFLSSRSSLDLNAVLHLTNAKRFVAKTGTDLGNGEGTGYANFTLKNLLGGAEILSFDASIGTRTKSSYVLNLTTPILNSARWKSETVAYITSRNIPWASHDQAIRGISTKIKHLNYELGAEAVWRSISTHDHASRSIRALAGNNIKTSIYHSWTRDNRENPLMPGRGWYLKLGQEIGGFLARRYGENPFIKTTFDYQVATTLDTASNFTFTLSTRGGLLYTNPGVPTHIMDRFFLGGPNDVRGFYVNALGPRDNGDSIGGEAYFAAGLGLLTRIPRVSKDTPLRLQTFINAGSLSLLDRSNMTNTFRQLITQPSIAGGIGLVYQHPVARFELNFTLPLVARQNEGMRKGVQFGVGLSFL